jgi:hypothetical protein
MKLHVLWLLIYVLPLIACSADPPATPATIVETLAVGTLGAETVLPTSTLQLTPTAVPPSATPPKILETASAEPARPTTTLQPTRTAAPPTATAPTDVALEPQPRFQGLHFAYQATDTPRTTFPAGTEQIFAIWQYENMRPDHIVHRTWLKDGEVWLEREEAWDSAAYGAAGTLSAVSIYDFEVGLDPGAYLLQLRINGQIQQEAAFDILASGATEFVTLALSSETRVAKVINGRRLVVEDMAGNQRELAQVDEEIVDLRWFSDGRHLLYVEVDRSEQVGGSGIGVKHALWLVDVDTPALSQLSTFEENLHSPLIPFDNGYIALFSGSNYGDACFVDRQLRIMELDENLQRAALYGRPDFLGAPVSDAYWIYPTDKLSWPDNATHLRVPFEVTCFDAGNPADEGLQLRGEYVLDLTSFTAERVADLPLP